MNFELDPQKQRFLKLAIGSIAGSISGSERAELEELMRRTPVFRQSYRAIERELERERDEDFMELCLKVLFKTATPAEIDQLRSLEHAQPRKWQEFQRWAFVLRVIGESSKSPPACDEQPEPMPDAVRTRLLTELKAKREGNRQ
jgi:hypothetical protein